MWRVAPVFVFFSTRIGPLKDDSNVNRHSGLLERRQANQQARIAEGVESGQLTPRESTRLERREAKTRREIRRDRAANGGNLTPAEKAKINRKENRTSREIYRAKHNDRRM